MGWLWLLIAFYSWLLSTLYLLGSWTHLHLVNPALALSPFIWQSYAVFFLEGIGPAALSIWGLHCHMEHAHSGFTCLGFTLPLASTTHVKRSSEDQGLKDVGSQTAHFPTVLNGSIVTRHFACLRLPSRGRSC